MSPIVNRCRGCGAPISQPARGRRRQWCSDACRSRTRRQIAEGITLSRLSADDTDFERDLDEAVAQAVEELKGVPSDPDEAVVACIFEGRAVANHFAHAAGRARPEFSWHCEEISKEITALLRRHFQGQREPESAP